jgi:CHAD domain-containing protein
MSFQFGIRERPGDAVRRITLEELDAVRAGFEPAAHDATALHEIRKSLKKLRALLDLARVSLGDAARPEDRLLRDVGRQLARHRETDAIGALLTAEAKAAGSSSVRDLHVAVHLHHVADAVATDRKRDLDVVRRALGTLRRRMVVAPWGELKRGDCRRRLRKTYRAARSAYRNARGSLSDENIHEWRKTAKVLLNQARLLAPWGGTALTAYRNRLVKLDEVLGRARDCAFLASILRGVPAAEEPLRYGLGLRARLDTIARDQIVRSLRYGGKVFRRPARAFVARMIK